MIGLPRSSFFFGMASSPHTSLNGLGAVMKYSPTLKTSTRFAISISSRFPRNLPFLAIST